MKFYCRPRSVQSPFVYRKTPARNKARCRYTAWLYLVSATACKPQILKFHPRCFAPKSRQILFAALQNSDLLSKAAAGSRKTRAIKFTSPFAFVLSRSKHASFYRRLRRNDVSLDVTKILSLCSAEQAPLKFYLERVFKILSNSRRMSRSPGVA